MQNSFGTSVVVTLFGESHGEMVGAVLDGIPAGFAIDVKRIERDMEKRRAKGRISTARQESDQVKIVSGFFNGYTTGTALTILIDNEKAHSQDYFDKHYNLRPGHADYAAFLKYRGYQDYRGGGHFSGRLTAPLVAAGSICQQLLESQGISMSSHILQLYKTRDEAFSNDPRTLNGQFVHLDQAEFPVLNEKKGEEMKKAILAAKESMDSVGGIVETAILGVPGGLGEPFFDSIESVLAHLLFSIPALKALSFGDGFDFASALGSQANDPFYLQDGQIKTKTNHNGGINGGIANGMPILFQSTIKPTPSIAREQKSVNLKTLEEIDLSIHGRHDPAIIHRAAPVITAITAIGVLDLYMQFVGRSFLSKEA